MRLEEGRIQPVQSAVSIYAEPGIVHNDHRMQDVASMIHYFSLILLPTKSRDVKM